MASVSVFLWDIGRAVIIAAVLYGLAVVGIVANANRYNLTRDPGMPYFESFAGVKASLVSYVGLFIGTVALCASMYLADLTASRVVIGLAYAILFVLLVKARK